MEIYPIKIKGFEGQSIQIKSSSLFSGPKILINGEQVQKGPKRNQMLLRRNDGTEVIAFWKPRVVGLDIPKLCVDGKDINIVKPLAWYELLWCGISILLIFLGGLIGGIVGAISFSVNTKMFRSQTNPFFKYLATALISIIAFMIYIIVVALITFAIKK